MSQTFYNLDAADQVYFARQLEIVRAKTYDYKYPELRARKFIPVDNSAGPGADSVTFSSFTNRGIAKIISNFADDLPNADITGTQDTTQIKSCGASYQYNINEIRKSKMTGLGLDQRRANAARRAVDEQLDAMLAVGDGTSNMKGFLNQSSALVYSVPNGASGFANWARKTPSEILADLNGIENFIASSTLGVETPDTIIVPLNQLLLIKSTPFSATNASNISILDMFLKQSIFVKNVDYWLKLSGAGTASTDLMVCYKNDEEHLAGIVPQEFEQLPAEPRNLSWVVNCHARCGGTQVFYPLSMAYGSGI